jgi:hypothetical protein
MGYFRAADNACVEDAVPNRDVARVAFGLGNAALAQLVDDVGCCERSEDLIPPRAGRNIAPEPTPEMGEG